MRGTQMAENTLSFIRVVTKQRLLTVSIIIYILMVLLFYLPPLNDYWTKGSGNFTMFSAIVFIVFLVLTVLGALVIYKSGTSAIKREQKGFTAFAIGAILLFLVPFLSSLEVIGGGEEFLSSIHLILLVLGILICVVGMFFLAREGGYFSIWLFGTVFLTIFGGHEAFKFIIYTGTYGQVDRFLMIEGIGILLASFMLYIYAELKFVFLAYKIEEAQRLNDEKKYKAALEVLEKVLAIYPNYSTAWNNKGNIHYRMKEYEEARDCYDRVAYLDPEYPHTENNMKQVMKKLKRGRSSA